jgi:hypothetical protein
MKWVLIVAGVLVGLVLLVAFIGWLLPKAHVATRTMRFKKPTGEVWQVISSYADQPTWRKDLAEVERLPDHDGHEVWNEIRSNGETMPLETIESVAGKRLVRKIADPKMPFGGTWTYELQEDGDGCSLTITERGEVYNPIFRFVSKFTDMGKTIDGYLHALEGKFRS